MAASKRDHLIEMAIELFFKNGCHSVGIDRLLAEAGVAKMTLYAHFKSKDELILAAAEELHVRILEQMSAILTAKDRTPVQRLYDAFDRLEEFTTQLGFSGCPFVNLSVEFSDPEHPIYRLVQRHKSEVEWRMRDALEAAGVADSEELARQLLLLHEGAKVMVHVTGNSVYVKAARRAADQLLSASLPPE